MATAANIGLSRLQCSTCKVETLHKGEGCIHCGTLYRISAPQKMTLRRAWAQDAAMSKAKRRKRNAR
jgi:rRNA maturation protein Nop10